MWTDAEMCLFSVEDGQCYSILSCQPKASSLSVGAALEHRRVSVELVCFESEARKVKYRRATLKLASMLAFHVAIPMFATVFTGTIHQHDDETFRKKATVAGNTPFQQAETLTRLT